MQEITNRECELTLALTDSSFLTAMVPVTCSDHEWCLALFVFVNVRPCANESVDHRPIARGAMHRRQHECGAPVVVSCFDVGFTRQQQRNVNTNCAWSQVAAACYRDDQRIRYSEDRKMIVLVILIRPPFKSTPNIHSQQ